MGIRDVIGVWKFTQVNTTSNSTSWQIYHCGYLHMTLTHSHHYADISEGIWNSCQTYSVASMSKIKSFLSNIFQTIYGAVCIQLTHSSDYGCENTCTWSYYHHQNGNMTHLPFFRVRSWNNVFLYSYNTSIVKSGQKCILWEIVKSMSV